MRYDVGSVILIVSIAAFYATGHWIAASVLLFIDIAHRGKNSR
jgi:hypothetical protein